VRSDYTAQAEILAEKLGYHFYFAKAFDVDGSNPYGNALLSKHPILFAETIGIPDPEIKDPSRRYETRCLLRASIDVPGGLTVCVTHFGLNPDEQLNAAKTSVDAILPTRCILMGDFNLPPKSPTLSPIRERLYDTAELFSEPLLSFPSDNPIVKIDYIFTTHDIKVLSADIPKIVASDHRPYLATIELP
jgi:endonuclease/exonuclease/phosphatase family metal-dependent hydrolase